MIATNHIADSARPWTWAAVLLLANSLAIGIVLVHRDAASADVTAAQANALALPDLVPFAAPALVRGPPRLVVLHRTAGVMGAWLVDPQTGTAGKITADGQDVSLVSPSPSGELAYVLNTGPDHWALEARALDGTGQRSILANQQGEVTSMAWSPRGDLLAYEVTLVNNAQVSPPRLWLIQSDGSNPTLVYGRSQETASRPVWSPDGRQVGFYENRQRLIVVFDFTTRLITVPTQINAAWSWSPDDKFLAYTDRADSNSPHTVVKVANLTTPVQTRSLSTGAFSDSLPAWSPAGNWIAFVRAEGTSVGVWVTRPDGSGSHRLHEQPGWSYSAPVWAPDGSAVAFSRHPARVGALELEPEVWVVPLQGQARQLATRGSVAAWVP